MSNHATYRIGDAIAVTQRLGDGTWMATFPSFVGFGAAECDALVALAAEVEGAAKLLAAVATSQSTEIAEAAEVVVRTYTAPCGDVRGQVVSSETGEILHESMWTLLRKDARRDAEEIATRHGYRVVEVSE